MHLCSWDTGSASQTLLLGPRSSCPCALYRAPFDVIPARFGSDSAKRHRDEAQRAVLPYHELALPTLAIDIDVAEDLQEALRAGTLGSRTREALRALGVEGA